MRAAVDCGWTSEGADTVWTGVAGALVFGVVESAGVELETGETRLGAVGVSGGTSAAGAARELVAEAAVVITDAFPGRSCLADAQIFLLVPSDFLSSFSRLAPCERAFGDSVLGRVGRREGVKPLVQKVELDWMLGEVVEKKETAIFLVDRRVDVIAEVTRLRRQLFRRHLQLHIFLTEIFDWNTIVAGIGIDNSLMRAEKEKRGVDIQ